jgi:CheY-like chemotaxis protein
MTMRWARRETTENNMLKPILLVEDDKRDLELTLIALERSQLANDVIVLRDGAMALDYLRREGEYAERAEGNPAVILLDLKLPKVTGLEVLQAVRADAGLRSIPVVMLTSSQEESDVLRSYEFGVNAYVVKPVAFDQFVSAIAELGIFWAVLNEPPPGSLKATRRNE